MSEFVYKEEYRWLTNACLNLTDACPLCCRYCFVEQHPHYMTLETARAAVNYLLENLDKKRQHTGNQELRANITYFGGEPTLLWDEIIVPLTSWIREEDLPIDLSMTTNGVLLNEERIKFLYDNNVPILLSIDGNKETQDYNRPFHNSSKSSFDAVAANIPTILKYFPNTTFRATIWPETAHLTFLNYAFAMEQGFKNIFFIPDARHIWTEEQKENLHNEVHKIFALNGFLFEHNFKPIQFSTINDMFKEMLMHDIAVDRQTFPKTNIYRECNRCGLATGFGAIGYDGSIYGCQEQPSKDNNIFYIGNIFQNGINQEKHIVLLKEYHQKAIAKCINEKLCDNCLLRTTCYGHNCPSSSWDLFHNFHISAEIGCLWLQWIFEDCIVLNNELVKQNNLLFKDYLDNDCCFNDYLIKDGE